MYPTGLSNPRTGSEVVVVGLFKTLKKSFHSPKKFRLVLGYDGVVEAVLGTADVFASSLPQAKERRTEKMKNNIAIELGN